LGFLVGSVQNVLTTHPWGYRGKASCFAPA
jgi:hypothetical protein